MSLLKTSGLDYEQMIKQALLAAIAKAVVKRPLTALGQGLNVHSAVEGAAQLNRQAGIGQDLGAFAAKTKKFETM